MPDFYFRGTLTEYWLLIHAEWFTYSHGDIHIKSPFAISHPFKDHPPREFEEVVLEFLDDYFRRPPEPEPEPTQGMAYPKHPTFVFPPREIHVPVTVRARSHSDGKSVRLTSCIEKEAHENSGKSALVRWNEIKTAWEEKGWLIDPLAQASQRVPKPKKNGLGRRYDSVKKMLEKIAYRDDWLANHKTAPAWSLKIEGGMDKHTANEINRDVGEAIKKQWNHTNIPGDAFANLLFEKYKHFPNLKVEWEIIKNRGV